MRVLALDTTARRGSVAVVDGDRVIAEHESDGARTHAEQLPQALLDVLDAAEVRLESIDVFAVASGPGSFTGLRIGIAAIQGLALVSGRPVVSVSLLEALGHVAGRDRRAGAVVAGWIDAHRHDVFAALYRLADTAGERPVSLVEIDAPRVGGPDAILLDWRARGSAPEAIAGDGAVLYRDAIAASVIIAPPAMAGVIGQLAAIRAGSGATVTPAAIQPLYVRRPDAEMARELKP